MPDTGDKTVRALRGGVALQIAQFTRRLGITQIRAAKQLGIPQPTLSKIVNARVSDISLELLIRLTVRAGLSLSLQTGHVAQNDGAFVSNAHARALRYRLSDEDRDSLIRSQSLLSPSQRLEAFLEHSQHLAALRHAGHVAEAHQAQKGRFRL